MTPVPFSLPNYGSFRRAAGNAPSSQLVPVGADIVPRPDPGAVERYEKIASALDDNRIRNLATHAGVPENVVRSVKSHMFETYHMVEHESGVVIRQRFTPYDEIADVWEAALRGEGRDEFRKLLGHEYLESTLMKHMGLPYLSPGWGKINPDIEISAHTLSPNWITGEFGDQQLKLWEQFLESTEW
jgi:hypothetical protein